MQFWHRRRSKRTTARIRIWADAKDAKLLGFAAYKAGMTHALVTENRPNSPSKGEDVSMPLTILECPPMRVVAIEGLASDYGGLKLVGQQWASDLPKQLARAVRLPKKPATSLSPDALVDVRVLLCSQPWLIGLKHTPEIIEMRLGGNCVPDKLAFAQSLLGKEVPIESVFGEGQHVDTHAITTGKGLQGPVKRHGVEIRSHKSQKTIRGPATLGPWHGNRSWRVAHQGQMGFFQRTEHNKWIVKIGKDGADVTPKGGFLHYGLVKGSYVAVKGSVGGPCKRLITLTVPTRPNKGIPKQAPAITYLSRGSKQ
jgi:large subunit ribosomal protein L3